MSHPIDGEDGTERALADLMSVDGRDDGPAPALDDLARQRFVARVMDRARQPSASSPRPAQEDRRRRWVWATIAFVPAAAAGLVVMSRSPAVSPGAPAAPAPVVASAEALVTLAEGTIRSGDRPLARGAMLAEGSGISVAASGRAGLDLGAGIRVWLDEMSEARLVRLDAGAVRLRLDRGRAAARVAPQSGAFSIETSAGTAEVKGTFFSVTVSDDAAELRVHEGTVLAHGADGSTRVVPASHRASLAGGPLGSVPAGAAALDAVLAGEPPPAPLAPGTEPTPAPAETTLAAPGSKAPLGRTARAAAPTVSDILAEAAAHRTARRWRSAADSYRMLRRAHPGSDAACTALISLGQLALDHLGDGPGALRSFEAYLAECARGPLAEEGAYGRAEALGRLGRDAEQRRALADFIARHAGSLRQPAARVRLGDLDRKAGRCDEARRSYQQALAEKPGSEIERDARQGLALCDGRPR